MGPNNYTPRSFRNFKPKWKENWVFQNRDLLERYHDLLKFIHEEKRAEWDDYWRLISMYCENEDDHTMLKDFLIAAKTPMGKATIKSHGSYEGPGHYGYKIINEETEDDPRVIDIFVYKLI